MIQTLRLTSIVFKITGKLFQENDDKVKNWIYRKKQIENIELKSPITEIKKLIDVFNSRFGMTEE